MDESTKLKLHLTREIARIERGCFDLGITRRDLEEMAGFSRGLTQQWKKRIKNGGLPDVARSMAKLKQTLHELTAKKAEETSPPAPQAVEAIMPGLALVDEATTLTAHIKQLERDCANIGITPVVLEARAGLKPGLVRQWKHRMKKGHITRVRQSTLDKLAYTLKAITKEQDDAALGKMREARMEAPKAPEPVMQLVFDDAPKAPEVKPTINGGGGCAALRAIIQDKISGYTLVQLAMLLAHLEGK